MKKTNCSAGNIKCSYKGCDAEVRYSVEWTEHDRSEKPEIIESYFSCPDHEHLIYGSKERFDEFGQPNVVWDLLANEDRQDLVTLLNKDLSPA